MPRVSLYLFGETKIPGYLTSSLCANLYCTRLPVLPASVTKIWGDFPNLLTFSDYYFSDRGRLSFSIVRVIFLEVHPNSIVGGKISMLKKI